MLKIITTLILLLVLIPVFAADLQVLGLYKDKVVVLKDGQTFVLSVGEEKHGIKVIGADSQKCTLQVQGKVQDYTIGNQISVNFAQHAIPTIRIEQDNHGQYRTSGTMNGQLVNFVVDTGASMVVMNSTVAEQLGIEYRNKAPVPVETASRRTQGYTVNIDKISLGGITAYNVPGVVMEGSMPRDVLLGVSFLKQVDINDHNHVLELKQKY